jgi:CheY-like chemotaxis protein
MTSVLICASNSLIDRMRGTLLWRDDVERRVTEKPPEAVAMALSSRPDLFVVDIGLEQAEALIAGLRANPVTRTISIVAVARGEFDPSELRFIGAGANAILRFPAGPDWDERLSKLLYVPVRRTTRLAALVQFEVTGGIGVETIAGTVLNLSEHGMLVETDVPLPMGSDIDFKIHLRDKPAPLTGCGQIVRQESARRSGVRFYGLEDEGLDRVRRFVDKA